MARRLKVQTTEERLNGLHCSICGELQVETPSGASCKHGHGGAEGVGPQEVPRVKEAWAMRTGETLKVELHKSEVEERQSRARITFASANAAKKSPMRSDVVRMVETVFVQDIETEAKKLIAELALGEQRNDRGSVINALDRAQANALKAHALYATCQREREAWEKRNDVLFAGMRVEANRALQEEKDKGHRNKTITNGDIDAMMALLFGDEWVVQENERRDYKLVEEHMKNLAERWANRSHNLQAISSTLR